MAGNTLFLSEQSTPFFIRYYPHLRKHFGSNEPVLLIDRLEYWFKIAKHRDGFFKFLEPCQHRLCKPGDSWEEEIGFSRRLFNKAFDLIGVRYKSKTAFLNAVDPFGGKPYASYHDRKGNRNYYVRNHDFADGFFKSLFGRQEKSNDCSGRAADATNEATVTSVVSALGSQKREGKGAFLLNKCRYSNDTKCRSPYISLLQRNTATPTVSGSARDGGGDSHGEAIAEGMTKVWIEEIGEVGIIGASTSLTKRLNGALSNLFEGSLVLWRNYCRNIASSKFLMGEARNTNFKIWMTWAIQPQTKERIDAGEFRYDRTPAREQEESKERASCVYERQNIQAALKHLRPDLEKERRARAEKRLKELPDPEAMALRSDFERDIETIDPGFASHFKETKWMTPFADVFFTMHLSDKFFGKLDDDAGYLAQVRVLKQKLEEIG